MRLLHTSDWHLGRVLHERPMGDDQDHALTQVLDMMKDGDYDALVVAGDIYDRSIPSTEAVRLLSSFFARLRSFSAVPVFMIPGNHDSAVRLAYCAELMALSGVHIGSDPFVAHRPLALQAGDTVVRLYLAPFLEPHVFSGYDNDHSDGSGDDRPRQTHESAVKTLLRRIEGDRQQGALAVFVGHLFATGGMTSESERTFLGGAGLVDPALLASFDYAALGHLHRPQRAGERCWYSGSLAKYSFSESGDVKGALSVELGRGECSVEALNITPLRDMARIRGSLQALLNSGEFNAHEGSYLEVELTDPALVANPLAILRRRFPHVLAVRQSLPEPGMGARRIESMGKERSLEDDYRAFREYLYDRATDESELELFREMCREGGVS
jgi:exonuclease SbcD